MKNVFENAYFGKAYRTRDGRKATYIKHSQHDDDIVLVVYEDIASIHRVMNDGHYWANHVETENDIVSEWQEEPINLSLVENGQLILECIKRKIYISKKNEINEEELDKLAEHYCPESGSYREGDIETQRVIRNAYKAGFRAKGNYCVK